MTSLLLRYALIFAAVLSFQVFANEIYKTIDENGNVHYSDSPPNEGAEPVALPDINVEPGVVPRVRVRPDIPVGPEPIQVWIAAPENESTIGTGALSFSVSGGTNRALLENEYAQLFVNGNPQGGQSKVLQWSVGNLVRGEYQIEIRILSSGLVQASSGTQKVHVQRAFAR